MSGQVLTNGHLSLEADAEESSSPEPAENMVLEGNSEQYVKIKEPRQDIHWDLDDIKAMIEALLFVSHDPLTIEKLASVIEDVPKATLKTTMQTLQAEYEQVGRGLQLVEVAGGFMMVTRPEHSAAIKRLSKAKNSAKLSRSALETLAIIGYKQPITRSDIEKIRGVETSGVLRTLLDQKLARIVGRQEMPGRPILYGTTKQFLQRFGLRDLRDLPPLKELKDLGNSEAVTLELPFESEGQSEVSSVADLSA